MAVDPRNLAELRDALEGNPDALDLLEAFDPNADDDADVLVNERVDAWAADIQATKQVRSK